MPKGGKQPGAGRPVGSTKENKRVQVGVRLPAWQVEWLRERENVTKEIEEALEKHIRSFQKYDTHGSNLV